MMIQAMICVSLSAAIHMYRDKKKFRWMFLTSEARLSVMRAVAQTGEPELVHTGGASRKMK
jgi:hypothetical protein